MGQPNTYNPSTHFPTHARTGGLSPPPPQSPSPTFPNGSSSSSSHAPAPPHPTSAQHLRPSSALATSLPYTTSSSGAAQQQHQQPPQHRQAYSSSAPMGATGAGGTAALRSEAKQKLANILDNFPSFDSEIKTGIKVWGWCDFS